MEEQNDDVLPNRPAILLFAIIPRSLEGKTLLAGEKDEGCSMPVDYLTEEQAQRYGYKEFSDPQGGFALGTDRQHGIMFANIQSWTELELQIYPSI